MSVSSVPDEFMLLQAVGDLKYLQHLNLFSNLIKEVSKEEKGAMRAGGLERRRAEEERRSGGGAGE